MFMLTSYPAEFVEWSDRLSTAVGRVMEWSGCVSARRRAVHCASRRRSRPPARTLAALHPSSRAAIARGRAYGAARPSVIGAHLMSPASDAHASRIGECRSVYDTEPSPIVNRSLSLTISPITFTKRLSHKVQTLLRGIVANDYDELWHKVQFFHFSSSVGAAFSLFSVILRFYLLFYRFVIILWCVAGVLREPYFLSWIEGVPAYECQWMKKWMIKFGEAANPIFIFIYNWL